MTLLKKDFDNYELDICNKKTALLCAKERLVSKFGWVQDYGFPDAIWRWAKTIKGQSMYLSLDDAINMESCLYHPEKEGE